MDVRGNANYGTISNGASKKHRIRSRYGEGKKRLVKWVPTSDEVGSLLHTRVEKEGTLTTETSVSVKRKIGKIALGLL